MGDRSAIENLLARYATCLDGADFEGLGELFATGSVAITGGPHSGREASGRDDVTALYRDIVQLDPATGSTGTQHLVTNIHIESDGDEAASHCYFAVLQSTPVLPLQVVASGRYIDRLHLCGDSWAFADRQILCDHMGDLTRHMR